MKKFVSLCAVFLVNTSYGTSDPIVTISFPNTPPTTVYYGETLRIPVQMTYEYLRKDKTWEVPIGTTLETVAGICPSIPYDGGTFWSGTCYMNIAIPGNELGALHGGNLYYHLKGKEGKWPNKHEWSRTFSSPAFFVKVIPHPLSMQLAGIQQATANLNFNFPLKTLVKYYDENARAGQPAQISVDSIEQDGIRYDPQSLSLVGVPKKIGTYHFKVGAKNVSGIAEPVDLSIQVAANPKDKPVFKKNPSIAYALSGGHYSLDLMNLIEPVVGFLKTNQLSFYIDEKTSHPDWLTISKEDPTILVGKVPEGMAGSEVQLTLIASSNTGGDSLPFLIKIPIAFDPTKKPVIEPFKFEQSAGDAVSFDIKPYINDPAHDPEIKVELVKVEPDSPWLHVSSLKPTVLEGLVPTEDIGQKYVLTLRAISKIGGHSEPITVPLQIQINDMLTPKFKLMNPILPLVYSGQSYFYDFMVNQDVTPEYDEFPYEIRFADGYEHPEWLKIENNTLTAKNVPDDVDDSLIIYLVITNKPGGASKAIRLELTVMK